MSDKFYPIPIKQLLELILREMSSKDSYFGIPSKLFFMPRLQANNPLATTVFGHPLSTPLGVAAGPHTQLAQNIVGAWLMGARYIELKTIQTLDELDVSKPCIDMQDEGYNCEWSQELKIHQSFDEYLNAWIIIHILHHHFGWPGHPATVFNMSVGYNLEGIRQENVQWFFDSMRDCNMQLQERRDAIREVYPDIDLVDIPTSISDNVTLSTMHGCPAGEIEAIARHLMEERGLHTYVKLNPTLLGPVQLRDVLNRQLGFRAIVPDQAFEHDLKYPDAVPIIRNLMGLATKHSLEFGLKLTNTLESDNHKEVFGEGVDSMYMSGRALHPLAINLAAKLQQEFEGQLSLSFSAGVDAFNVADVLSCGFKTVTVCSDLLKPGGYMRLRQYFDNILKRIEDASAEDMPLFPAMASEKASNWSTADQNRHNGTIQQDLTNEAVEPFFGESAGTLTRNRLDAYGQQVLKDTVYKRSMLHDPDIKTGRKLGYFDCISAPCRDTCATSQDVPGYMHFVATRQFDKALEVILRTNPFPTVTGMVCDHLCQNKCTRMQYDDPLLIREVKRFVAEHGKTSLSTEYPNGLKVAIVGAGPAGLSCAFFLALAGFAVEVYESQSKAGGMVQYAIPGFRLTGEAIEKDLLRITDMGVRIHYDTIVDKPLFAALRDSCKYVFVGAGAQLSAPLHLDGIDAEGVVDPLAFLKAVKGDAPGGIGRHVLIVGGGNTAMDAARTAWRLVGHDGSVTIVYRRTINEMPADHGEIRAVLDEGMKIIELAAPERVVADNGKVVALRCSRMELSDKDESGRRRPVKVADSAFDLPCDTIIPAVGQLLDVGFAEEELLSAQPGSYLTRLDNVFVGGDAMRGASTAINAIGDGRKAAAEIMQQAMLDGKLTKPQEGKLHSAEELMLRRSQRAFAPTVNELAVAARRHFQLVQQTLGEEAIVQEAGRCLHCDELCNTCVTVCPNFANVAYETTPLSLNLNTLTRNRNGNGFHTTFDRVFEIRQATQILNIANFCNECGNCNTFCPTSSAPYKEKPRLHLGIESFYASDEGYYLSRLPDRDNLIWKHKGSLVTFSETPDAYFYEAQDVMVELDKEDFKVREARFLSDEVTEVSLLQAARMLVVLKGATGLINPPPANPRYAGDLSLRSR